MSEQDFTTIEAYLEGALTPTEAASVEARIAKDAEFAKAFADRRRLYEHLKAEAVEPALIENLSVLNEKFFSEEVSQAKVRTLPKGRRWWLLGIAAAAMLALAILLGGQLFAPTQSTYEQFAQHQPLSLVERGSASTAEAAEAAFNEGRYAEAIDRLRSYLAGQKDDQRAQLALGIALLERNQDTAAVEIFTEIAESQTPLAAYGNWYLALAAVKQGNNNQALRFLSLIPKSDTFLADRVRKLKATL